MFSEVTDYALRMLNDWRPNAPEPTGGKRALITVHTELHTIAYLWFVDDPGAFHSQDRVDAQEMSGTRYLPVALLDSYVDMLRNEKPLYLLLMAASNNHSIMLSTRNEPVGEGED